ncbi:hypothetical protein MDA_GLEAN10012082 [Myotis davidii]|uniref:DUF4502 domain-containing protein n=1 Tax=Myotis davidii TaxID=225400 RepID=L5MFV9_MYODS|nr:hypothetical protein MDA_GLEAN10012082 [Myotis davidii]
MFRALPPAADARHDRSLVISAHHNATTSKSASGLTDITWSSSGSDQSDEDELQFVDWERDSDREDTNDENEFEDSESAVEDGESAVEISDCASCASSHSLTSEERVSELPKCEVQNRVPHFGGGSVGYSILSIWLSSV